MYCTRKFNYFTNFYEGVEYGVDIQRFDSVCNNALTEYTLCSTVLEQKEWLLKYFDLGYNKLAIFCYDHLDYSVNIGEVIHPHFGNSPVGEFGACIDRKYYENLIEFENVFKTLYYERKGVISSARDSIILKDFLQTKTKVFIFMLKHRLTS